MSGPIGLENGSPYFFWRLANAAYMANPQRYVQKKFPEMDVTEKSSIDRGWLMVLFQDRVTKRNFVSFKGTDSYENCADHCRNHVQGYAGRISQIDQKLNEWVKKYGKLHFFTGHSAGGSFSSWSTLDWNHTIRVTFNGYACSKERINQIHLRSEDDPFSPGPQYITICSGGHGMKTFKNALLSKRWCDILSKDQLDKVGHLFSRYAPRDKRTQLVGDKKFYLQKIADQPLCTHIPVRPLGHLMLEHQATKEKGSIVPAFLKASAANLLIPHSFPVFIVSVVYLLAKIVNSGYFGDRIKTVEQKTSDFLSNAPRGKSIRALFKESIDQLPEDESLNIRLFFDAKKGKFRSAQVYQADADHAYSLKDKPNANRTELLNCELRLAQDGKFTLTSANFSLINQAALAKIPEGNRDWEGYRQKVSDMARHYLEVYTGTTEIGEVRAIRGPSTNHHPLLLSANFLEELRKAHDISTPTNHWYEIKVQKERNKVAINVYLGSRKAAETVATFDSLTLNSFRTMEKDGISKPNYDEFLVQAVLPSEGLGLPGDQSFALETDSRYVAPVEVPFVGLLPLTKAAPKRRLCFDSSSYNHNIHRRMQDLVSTGKWHDSLEPFLKTSL